MSIKVTRKINKSIFESIGINEDNASIETYQQRIEKIISKFDNIDPEFQNKINLYMFLKMISSDNDPDKLIGISKQKVAAWSKKLGKDEQLKIFDIFLTPNHKEKEKEHDDNIVITPALVATASDEIDALMKFGKQSVNAFKECLEKINSLHKNLNDMLDTISLHRKRIYEKIESFPGIIRLLNDVLYQLENSGNRTDTSHTIYRNVLQLREMHNDILQMLETIKQSCESFVYGPAMNNSKYTSGMYQMVEKNQGIYKKFIEQIQKRDWYLSISQSKK